MYRICPSCHLPAINHTSVCPDCAADLAGVGSCDGTQLEGAVIEQRYELIELLGEGSMSWVYRGLHQEIGSSVAVKVLKPAFAQDPGQLARFRKEAAAISVLSHPHILSVITSGETASHIHYMVTEYIHGRTLAQVIEAEGKLPVARSMDILRQILFALEEAHDKGIVHRDLKPENIMVIQLRSGEDFCKIVDFGIARRRVPDESRLTRQGEIIGTPAFMAPEVIRGEEARAQSDLFSAGVIFYEMLTGDLPWARGSLFETLLAHLNQEPVPLRKKNPDVPAKLERIVSMALINDPEHRIPTATDFLRLLQSGSASTITVCATCFLPVQGDKKFCPNCGRLQEAPAPEASPAPARAPSSAPVPDAPMPGVVRRFEVPFWGRSVELAQVQNYLINDAVCLEVSGEAGVGKRALVTEALGQRASGGARVVLLTPDSPGSRRSWWPIRLLVARLRGLPVSPSPDQVESLCRDLAMDPEDRPHIFHLFELGTDPLSLEYRVRRREMIISAARLVHRVLGGERTLLACLNADRFDAPTRDVLVRLVTLCEEGPLRLLVTSVQPVMPQGDEARGVVFLRLSRFTPDASLHFCKEVLARNGTGAGESLSPLVAAAGGLPLHLVEGLRLLHEGLSIVDQTLSDIVQQRVRTLPGPAHRLLQWTAVAGGRLSLSMARASGLLEPGTLAAVGVAVAHGFLMEACDEELVLAHPTFGRIISAEMSTALRQDMHGRLFDHLRLTSADPRQLCDHAMQARQLETAASYFERSGALCEDLFDDPGAVLHYRRAYELTEFGARQGRDVLRFRNICIRFGDLLRFTGQIQEAARVLQEALLTCPEEDAATAPILTSLARCLCETVPEHAENLVQRAVKSVRTVQNPLILYRVFFDIGQIALQTRRHEQGLGSIRTGLSLLEGLRGVPESLWRLYLQCAQCEAGMGRTEQAAQTCQRTLERADLSAGWLPQARLHEELAALHIARREPSRAADRLRLALGALRFTGDRVSVVENELRLAALDRENREAWAQSAWTHARRIGHQAGVDQARRLLKG